MGEHETSHDHHVCPVWVGYFLASPLRKLFQNPEKILGPYLAPGMCVLDLGCAMGFFSLPMARAVGEEGRVVCVDLQQRMLDALRRRARRKGLAQRIETRCSTSDSLGIADLAGRVDFALAFAVAHEIADGSRLFSDLRAVLKPGSNALIAEPSGHVSEASFEKLIAEAEACGFCVTDSPTIHWSHAVVLQAAV